MLRLAKTSLLAGGLVAGGIVAATVGAGANPAAFASGGQSLSTALLSNRGAASTPGPTVPGAGGANGYGFGRGGRHGGYDGYGFGRGLTVTGVSGNTITAMGRGAQTITVQVSATTAYTEAGASASLSDVKTGAIIAVRGSNATTSATTINATGITIVLPQVAGVVTSVSGSTLTLTGFNGTTRTVTVGDATRYQKAGGSAALSDIATGTANVAEGTANSDGSLSAVRVTIQVPRVGGQVTAVNGASYTVAGRVGQAAYTIATTGSTTFVNADGSTAAASAIKTGSFIVAEGTLSSDGKTLTAQRVTLAPAGVERGYGGHGGFGPGADGATTGATAPSTTGTSGTASI